MLTLTSPPPPLDLTCPHYCRPGSMRTASSSPPRTREALWTPSWTSSSSAGTSGPRYRRVVGVSVRGLTTLSSMWNDEILHFICTPTPIYSFISPSFVFYFTLRPSPHLAVVVPLTSSGAGLQLAGVPRALRLGDSDLGDGRRSWRRRGRRDVGLGAGRPVQPRAL